uniref:Uncharacterized protein n=1 Tax=Cajanus cajan TaxID=3821 RepID=A0A151QS79_CAJCA|nr:hypothetical protein KK1_046062 [Cajanus cajan]
MKIGLQNQTKERPQLPPKMCKRGELSNGHKHDCLAMSSWARLANTYSYRPSLVQGAHGGFLVPKMLQGNKEVLRRALTPPTTRRIGFRWLNFRPTPSRLSNMSTA